MMTTLSDRRNRRLWRDRRAGVALLFALSVVPIIGLLGLAIDFGYASQARTGLNAAADAAALASAKSAADAFTAKQSGYIAVGNAAGLEWFKAQAAGVQGVTTAAGSPSVNVVQNGAVFTSTVSYKGSVKPFIAPMFGVSSLSVGGLSSATITTTPYTAVTFLLDNSSSMLIASTQAGVNKLNSLTPTWPYWATVPDGLGKLQCAFACHWDAGNKDYYGLARSNNIELRFDVLQTAVASAINQMISQTRITNQFAVGIYTFNSALKQIYPVGMGAASSTDLVNAIAASDAMRSPVTADVANTDFPTIMAALVQASTAAGDGSVIGSPKKTLIIVTDGLVDYGSRTIPSSKGPINPANCAGMKALGYNVFVLYTTYITTPSAALLPFDNIGLLPYINGTATPTMAGSLQACASKPANFAEASDPVAINAAMTLMLQAALMNGGRFLR